MQGAGAPAGVDRVEHAHQALRGGRRSFGEQVVGGLAALAQVEQQHFRLAVGVAVAEQPLQASQRGAGQQAQVVAGIGQRAEHALGVARLGRVEQAGADAHAQRPAQRVLRAQTFGGARGIAGHRLAQRRQFAQAATEHPRAADLPLRLRRVRHVQAGLAAQFAHGPLDAHREARAQAGGIVLAALFIADPARVALSVVGALLLNMVLTINHRPGRYFGQ